LTLDPYGHLFPEADGAVAERLDVKADKEFMARMSKLLERGKELLDRLAQT
jgi:archaellum biogenesis protein FlaJ (TadC family)